MSGSAGAVPTDPMRGLTETDDPRQRAEEWLEIDRRVRERVTRYDTVDRKDLGSGDGLSVMKRLFSGELPAPPIMKTLDFSLVLLDRGLAVFQGTPKHEHYNPIGSVHGGYIATLLDSCVGCAVHTTIAQGQGYTTLELKVNYVRAVTDRVGPLRAIGTVINASRQIAIADGKLVDASGKLFATCSTTCMIFPLPA